LLDLGLQQVALRGQKRAVARVVRQGEAEAEERVVADHLGQLRGSRHARIRNIHFLQAEAEGAGQIGSKLVAQATAVIDWRLKNDTGVREAIYETDADITNRFFMGLLGDQAAWRDLIVTEHGILNEDYPNRYKRFFVAGDTSHTAIQTSLFYNQTADGVLLNEWTADFLDDAEGWVDIVEEP
jgi:hypothetical protein